MSALIKNALLCCLLLCVISAELHAAVSQLNSGGGSSVSNGLRTYIDDTTQIQVRRLNNTGQLYPPNTVPSSTNLDNGIYLRANGALIGPDHFGFPFTLTPTAYINRSVSTATPATVSQGVTQSLTSQFSAPRFSTQVAGPSVTVVWKYIYPLDYITAEVTLVIPESYPVSASNPVRYYHAVDTYLGGSDNGCGVRYVDSNGKQVVGTYPLTSGNCPSSNSLPANLDVVESFRERNGKFDHYCVGFWNTFWTNSNSNACAIGKSNSLSDTVTTTYQDTGAAIEYDFTASGTYTFSYDFVVGSTFVPNYDHLEIRHSGSATLCPTEVQVLACLSSTVPCPDDQMVSTGSLTGSLTFSPGTPTVTETPDPFELGSLGPVSTVTLQGSSAATYTMSATGLSKSPLNGVKCWNNTTNSQSCSFTFTNTPCVSTFECMENSLTYNNLQTTPSARNPLYTKVFGTSFDVDVVALLSSGAQSSGYNSTTGLTVQLVDDNSGSCGATVVASKVVTFAASDSGRKKVTFSSSDVLRPHPGLRCKVTDAGLLKTGCSSDNFAIRPQSLSVTSINATQASPGPASTPVFKAGANGSGSSFSLTTSSGELTYTGTPLVDNAKLVAHTGAPVVGQLTGSFPAATLGSSTGSAFNYTEVGHFKFSPQGVYDNTYTFVDSAKGDCDNSSSPFDNTGTGSPKKYGCRFGNTVDTSYFGRFIPDHFLVTPSISTLACGSFVYYGQDSTTTPGLITPFTLVAQNAANATTQNYTGSYAKFDLASWAASGSASSNYQFTATPLNGATLSASAMTPAVSGTWSNGSASVIARHKLSRPASAISPQTVIVSAQPQETDSSLAISSTKTALNAGVPYRYGRLAVTPAHGSELLPLQVPIEAQYWNGSAYIRSLGDSCTSVDPKSITMRNYRGNLSACETYISSISSMGNGVINATLAAPKVGADSKPNTGSVDLEININSASGEQTCQNSGAPISSILDSKPWFGATDPSARASFGIYKAPIIYMRENF